MSGVASAIGISTATMEGIGTAASLLGAGVGAIGSIESGEAAESSAKYNSEIASANQTIATNSANQAAAAGEAQTEQASLKSRATVGAIEANQAAGGIDVNSGSALDVRSSAQELGELSALTIRSNAAKTAYGYQTQAYSYGAESQLDNYEAENAVPGAALGAAGNVLGGVGSAAENYAKFTQAGGGSGNVISTGGDDVDYAMGLPG